MIVKGSSGSGSMGRIVVSNGKTAQGSGVAVQQGVIVDFTSQDIGTCELGNIVDFTITESMQNGVKVRSASQIVASPGIKNLSFVYDPTAPANYAVGANESLYANVQGAWPGNFSVSGGTLLLLVDPAYAPTPFSYTAYSGALTTPADKGAVLVFGMEIQQTIKIDTDSDMFIKDSQIATGVAIQASKKSHVIIRNTNVVGTVNAIG